MGKHSEVVGVVTKDEIIEITDVEKIVNLFEDNNLNTGFNPFEYTLADPMCCVIDGESINLIEDMTVEEYIDFRLNGKKS